MKLKKVIVILIMACLILTLVGCNLKHSSPTIYTVSFYDGETLLSSATVEDGNSVQKPADPTKEHYTFKEWCTDSALTQPYDFSSAITGDLSLFASFVPTTYTVSFYNGETLLSSATVGDGNSVQKPADPTKEHYTFKEWCTDSALKQPYDFSSVVTGDLSLFASFVPTVYTVSFYDGETLLSSAKVESGKNVQKPADPKKADYTFVGWFADKTYEHEFDFGTVIVGNTSVYAKYQQIDYFANYSDTYLPNYSPLLTDDEFFEGDENPSFTFVADGIDINSTITAKQIKFHGAFSNLTIDQLSVSNNTLRIQTTGVIQSGDGAITLAKEATNIGGFITAKLPIYSRYLGVGPYGYYLNSNNKTIYFTVEMENISLLNSSSHTPEEYLELVNNGTYPYFTSDAGASYTFNVAAIHDDFCGFDGQLVYQGDFDQAKANEIKGITFRVLGEALSDGKERSFSIDMSEPLSQTSMILSYVDKNSYVGEFSIRLYGCEINDSLADHISELLSEPLCKNTLITIQGAEVTLKSLMIVADNMLGGTIEVTSEGKESKQATINLTPIVSNGSSIVFTQSYFKGEAVPPTESVSYNFGYNKEDRGTVSQTASSSYKGVKTIIEDYTFSNDDENGLDELISNAISIGMIAYGLYSGDYTTAKYAAGDLLGIDSIRNPSKVILEALQSIMEELKEIEKRIDDISQQLSSIDQELQTIGQETLLNNFLDAYSTWNAFVTDYYTPLANRLNDFVNAYYLYYYDLALSSHPDAQADAPTILIYYDTTGALAFPDNYGVHSVDGKLLDKGATKTITIPVLIHAIAGIRANSEHAYSFIEDDILVDLLSCNDIDDSLLPDLIATLRFYAMRNYFSSPEKITGYVNAFTNFCNAFSNNELGGISLNFTPLSAFTTMLETIFNFGFEIEPDLNIVTSKIAATYYCAKQVLDFSRYLNNGEIAGSKYEEMETAFKNELESPRFHHYNDENGNIFCYAANAYVKYSCDAYGLIDKPWYDLQGGVRRSSDGNFSLDTPEIKSFESIDENTLKLMAIKVKVFNLVKKTNYSFNEYLIQNGMLSGEKAQKVKGFLLEINGIVGGGGAEDLHYIQPNTVFSDLMADDTYGTYGSSDYEYTHTFYDYNAWGGGIKGKAMSFDLSASYDGILALYIRDRASIYDDYFVRTKHSGEFFVFYIEMTLDDGDVSYQRYVGCYDFYINFAPVEEAAE